MVEDGFHWCRHNSPSGHPGCPVLVEGDYFYLPGDKRKYSVAKVIEQGGEFIRLVPLATGAVQP